MIKLVHKEGNIKLTAPTGYKQSEVNEMLAAQEERLEKEHAEEIEDITAAYEYAVNELVTEHEAEIEDINQAHSKELSDMSTAYENEIDVLNEAHENTVNELNTEHANEINGLNAEITELEEEIEYLKENGGTPLPVSEEGEF